MSGESDASTCQAIESGARRSLVPVGPQTVGTQGIDQEEEHVDVVAIRQGLDVFGGSHRSRVAGADPLCEGRRQQGVHGE
jgi:hypothetical protein